MKTAFLFYLFQNSYLLAGLYKGQNLAKIDKVLKKLTAGERSDLNLKFSLTPYIHIFISIIIRYLTLWEAFVPHTNSSQKWS